MVLAVLLSAAHAQQTYVNFESGPVRPIALSADAQTLFVTNIPDGQLEVYDVTASGLAYRGSVPVGLEPVAVAVRSADEVWVVNHLSDSVSVVDVPTLSVRRTLLVGDAPRDIVFAQDRAFVTTAHRGQHRTDPSIAAVPGAGDPQLTTEGVGRADVWVFDAAPAEAPFGLPLRIVELFGDTPRGLAVSADGATVYAAVFHSGNGTTVLSEGAVCDGFEFAGPCSSAGGIPLPGGVPGPSQNFEGAQAPEVGLIVKHEPGTDRWVDELDRDWSAAVPFELPDYDVFAIDAATLEPGERWSGVGTTLFNLATNPVTGALYVTNTDSHNEVRFEGPGVYGGSTVAGHLAESRITVIDGASVTPRHLNSHIDYSVVPSPPGTSDHSLATPLQIVVSSDGTAAYVAAFGSSRIGVFDTTSLETGNLDPTLDSAGYLETTGGGPAGLALDEAGGRLYVYTRFDNAVAALDLASGVELDKRALPIPEPEHVIEGRPFLYDANLTSSNGEASCASCHTFADMDHLAWDLGNPDDIVTTGDQEIKLSIASDGDINGTGDPDDFHPMKGPMTTQTLKGMQYSGALHWRGDRSVGYYGSDAYDEELSFLNFIVAFPGLVGREDVITDLEMTAFTDFAMSLGLPPNPVRNLDNSLTPGQQAAIDFYLSQTRISDGVQIPGLGFSCDGCHTFDRTIGAFGTNGDRSFENEEQIIKIPQLRNMYEKVGMFGMIESSFFNAGDNEPTGEQIRGFGFLHDGSVDTLYRFFRADVFDDNGPTVGFQSDQERRDMESMILAFDQDIAPVVGQQVTVDASEMPERVDRLQLLLDASQRGFFSLLLGGSVYECDVIAKTWNGSRVLGLLYEDGSFRPDDGTAPLTLEALLALAEAAPVTFTAVLPGTGLRRGIDRDEDGVLDGLDSCPYVANADTQDEGCLEEPTETADTGAQSTPDTGIPAEPDPYDLPEGDAAAEEKGGCGCDQRSGSALAPLGLAALVLARRRSSNQGEAVSAGSTKSLGS